MSQTILRDLLAHVLPTERLQAYLRFNTVLRKGDNHVHLVNASVFPQETRFHYIREGMTLCGRRTSRSRLTSTRDELDCPGCVSLAKGIIAREMTEAHLVDLVNHV
jgi:hypothetical protein